VLVAFIITLHNTPATLGVFLLYFQSDFPDKLSLYFLHQYKILSMIGYFWIFIFLVALVCDVDALSNRVSQKDK
jgi:hypothetical protein